MTKLEHLKALCERAQPAYENPCYVESENKTLHLFAQEFSPEFCLKLLSIIEIQGKALSSIDEMKMPEGHDMEERIAMKMLAYKALAAVEKILGE